MSGHVLGLICKVLFLWSLHSTRDKNKNKLILGFGVIDKVIEITFERCPEELFLRKKHLL